VFLHRGTENLPIHYSGRCPGFATGESGGQAIAFRPDSRRVIMVARKPRKSIMNKKRVPRVGSGPPG
jgi:hypothetical protein